MYTRNIYFHPCIYRDFSERDDGAGIEQPKIKGSSPESIPVVDGNIEIERFNMELGRIVDALRAKIQSFGFVFDTQDWIDNFKNYVSKNILCEPKFPKSAKEIFLSDLSTLLKRFERITMDDLVNSAKQNSLATLGTTLDSTPRGRLQSILDGNFVRYMHGTSAGLRAAFIESRQIGNGKYHTDTWNKFIQSLSNTDKINNFPRQLAAGCSVVSVFLFFLYSYSR